MKKVISAIAASVLAVSAFPISSASAIETAPANELSVSTEVLETSITVGDTVIPAGATAITINANNLTDFNATRTKLEINGNVVVGNNDLPVVSKGNLLDNSHIVGFVNEDIAVFSSASADSASGSGELFTFYISSEENVSSDDFEILDYFFDDASVSIENVNQPMGSGAGFYIAGDMNDDDVISVSDAVCVDQALAKAPISPLYHPYVESMPAYYFSYIYVADAAFIYTDYRGITKINTFDVILYYDAVTAGSGTFDPLDIDPLCRLGMPVPVSSSI